MTTQELLARARQARGAMALADTQTKDRALLAMADALEARQADILAANAQDLAAAREHGVLVCTAGGANAISVAELTIFYMLYCSRNFKKVQKLYLEDYRQAKMGVPKTELEGKTLGLVGLGNIGKLVAKKGAGIGMKKVIAYDPFVSQESLDAIGLPVTLVSQEELFRTADVISLHLPLTPETENFIGAAELAKMKPDAILINTARGGLIDENALLDALEAGRLCGAGIDAFSSEPPKDPRWFTLDNVVLGSHCAASTAGASRNMGRMATANLIHDLGL